MSVLDLQSWADTLEAVRLPAIETDITELQTLSSATATTLSDKVQEFTDNFSANAIRITVADSAADAAQLDATSALTKIATTAFDAKDYTDVKIQALKQLFDSKFNIFTNTLTANISASTDTKLDTVLPSVTEELNATRTAIQLDIAQAEIVRLEMETATDALLTEIAPRFAALQDEAIDGVAAIQQRMNNLLFGYEYDALVQGMDNVVVETGVAMDSLLADATVLEQASATSATNAGNAAAAANTSANLSANSATLAGDKAIAASTSASVAVTKADEASQSAGSASTSAQTATTKAGQASTSATNAATSEASALESKNSAGTFSQLTADSYFATVDAAAALFPSDFSEEGLYFTSIGAHTTIRSYPVVIGATFPVVPEEGKVAQWSNSSNGSGLATRGFIKRVTGRTYRIFIRHRVVTMPSTGAPRLTLGAMWFDTNGDRIGAWTQLVYLETLNVINVAAGWVTYEYDLTPPATVEGTGVAYFVPTSAVGQKTDWVVSNGTVQVSLFGIRDVTEELAVQASASAAASSASTATTKAREASTSATSASTSANTASTKAAEASTSETNAATSATSAAGSSATAVSAKETAVAVSSQGGGVLSDMLLPLGAGLWSGFSTAPTITANELYPTGNTWTWDLAANTSGGAQMTSNNSLWSGPHFSAGFRVEITYELISGSLQGAGVLFDFVNASNTNSRVTKSLDDMTPGPVVVGELTKASAVFERPSAASTPNYSRMFFMANYTAFGSQEAKNLKVHSVQIFPITLTEASVTTLETAVVDLQGNASAGYLIKAQAGSEVSLIDLIAADGSAGSVSVAKISATTILLNGSVTTQHLDANSVTADKISVTSLSAISATLGLFKSAASGARVEIQDDKITVYRANGTVAVKIGNLA